MEDKCTICNPSSSNTKQKEPKQSKSLTWCYASNISGINDLSNNYRLQQNRSKTGIFNHKLVIISLILAINVLHRN